MEGRRKLALARIWPAWKEIYYGLPRLIEQTQWVSELPEILRARGFVDVRVQYLTLYGSALVSARLP